MSNHLDLEGFWLDQLADLLAGPDEERGAFDPATGLVHEQSADGECFDENGDVCGPDDLDGIVVCGLGSQTGYADMEEFTELVPDPRTRERLRDALQGKGAFKRFRNVVYNAPAEIGKVWNRFKGARGELRALDWLEENELGDAAALEAARVRRRSTLEEIAGTLRPAAQAPTAGVVDLAGALGRFADHWSPKLIARIDDHEVKLVKVQGDFVWHTHATDELFLVLSGTLTIALRSGDVELGAGQLYVVPAGVEHCPRSDDEVAALLIDAEGVVNTGDAPASVLTAGFDDSLLGEGSV